MSNLDRFYGLVGEAGVVMGKFGHDAKPFFDRVREMYQIAWRSQATPRASPPVQSRGSLSQPSQSRGTLAIRSPCSLMV